MENNQKKKSIYQEREKYRQKAFFMMIEIAIIIALPAFIALFLGQYLDRDNPSSKTFTIGLLFISFILSWIIIIRKYIKLNKKMKEIDNKIKKTKENVDNSNNSK